MEKFINLGLSDSSMQALSKKGFEEPTEIQEKTIPLLLKSKNDIIAQAQTGTGKTAAFGLVFIEKLKDHQNHTQALVLTPTRELAIQVAEEINSLKGDKKLNIVPIYGGQSINLQLKQLKKGVDIIVGTPGRILDHLRHKTINFKNIDYAVLDEADEMLNMGFIDDIETILSFTNETKQLLLFSATIPRRIRELAKKYMKNQILIEATKNQLTTNLIDQIYFEVNNNDKFEALCRIIDTEEDFYGIIFCPTKVNVDQITQKLIDRGYISEALHGDIAQNQRERILQNFKNKRTIILVATDVAARGIDVNNLTHVINYSLPHDAEAYVHRIGRTGRAGNQGTAITFITPSEFRKLSFIKKLTNTEIRKKKLPNAKEIIEFKKNRIKNDILNIISNDDLTYYKELSNSILEEHIDRDTALAALLKHAYSDELDLSNYKNIENNFSKSKSVNSEGKTRLFITLGKMDNYTPKKLVEYIERQSGVNQHFIRNVDVFKTYSFVTVPFEKAEIILETFQNRKKGNNVVIEKASEKGSSNKKKKYRKY